MKMSSVLFDDRYIGRWVLTGGDWESVPENLCWTCQVVVDDGDLEDISRVRLGNVYCRTHFKEELTNSRNFKNALAKAKLGGPP